MCKTHYIGIKPVWHHCELQSLQDVNRHHVWLDRCLKVLPLGERGACLWPVVNSSQMQPCRREWGENEHWTKTAETTNVLFVCSVLLKTGLRDYTQHFKNEWMKYNTWVWNTSSEQKALFSVAKLSCLLTCWVYPALYLAVEKAPPVAVQLLIDSKKLVGSLGS